MFEKEVEKLLAESSEELVEAYYMSEMTDDNFDDAQKALDRAYSQVRSQMHLPHEWEEPWGFTKMGKAEKYNKNITKILSLISSVNTTLKKIRPVVKKLSKAADNYRSANDIR